jgi:hypothetical protein
MKGLIILGVITLFLVGFFNASSITGGTINNNSNLDYGYGSYNPTYVSPATNSTSSNDTSSNSSVVSANSENNNSRHPKLTGEQIKKMMVEKNRLKFENRTGVTCPDNCTCDGRVVKCLLSNGRRELIIYAGENGNMIIQIKGENMTTNVTLYKGEDGKIYRIFGNNETREIKLLPDQVKEKIREKLSRNLENETIKLDENGTYQYEGKNNATLFGIFHIREKINAQLDSQTGQVIQLKKPWWAFLARDEGQQIIGTSCVTAPSRQNDECCKTKGYDFWNLTIAECQFNSSN